MGWLGEGLDGLALGYAILFFPTPLFWLPFHAGIHFWRRFGNRSFLVALPVWLASGAALILLRDTVFSQRIDRSALTWLLGAILVGLAVWLNRQVYRQSNLRRLAGLAEVNHAGADSGLVRAGVYGRVRHPHYLEFMMSLLGLAFLPGAVEIFVLAIVTILLYLIVTPLEERQLGSFMAPRGRTMRGPCRASCSVYGETTDPRFPPE